MALTRIIDIHPHIIADEETRYPRNPLFGVQSDWSKTRPVTAERMVAAMDEAGVAKSAMVQASTCYGYDNSYVADAIARYPDRFTGVCSVDIRAPDACEKLAYWRGKGMSGLRLFTGGSTAAMDPSWLVDPKGFPAWEYAGEAGMPIAIQTDASGIPNVIAMAKRFPDVRIVLDHLGRVQLQDGPPYAAAAPLFSLADIGNVYLKTTPRTVEAVQQGAASAETFLPKLISAFGANRIAWGSNYPASKGSLAELLGEAKKIYAVVSDEDQAWIFGRTATVFYPALADK